MNVVIDFLCALLGVSVYIFLYVCFLPILLFCSIMLCNVLCSTLLFFYSIRSMSLHQQNHIISFLCCSRYRKAVQYQQGSAYNRMYVVVGEIAAAQRALLQPLTEHNIVCVAKAAAPTTNHFVNVFLSAYSLLAFLNIKYIFQWNSAEAYYVVSVYSLTISIFIWICMYNPMMPVLLCNFIIMPTYYYIIVCYDDIEFPSYLPFYFNSKSQVIFLQMVIQLNM